MKLWLLILFVALLSTPVLARPFELLKVTPSERDAIKKPKEGMVIYVEYEKKPSRFEVYTAGKRWRDIEKLMEAQTKLHKELQRSGISFLEETSPHITSSERDKITTPTEGLIVYITDLAPTSKNPTLRERYLPFQVFRKGVWEDLKLE